LFDCRRKKRDLTGFDACDQATQDTITSDNGYCGLIFNYEQPRNPFGLCFGQPQMNREAFAENCLFDTCTLSDNADTMKEAACETLSALAAQCRQLGYATDWRGTANCRE
jgi:hypothetical protein